jgi:pathogenesis-related protein 1
LNEPTPFYFLEKETRMRFKLTLLLSTVLLLLGNTLLPLRQHSSAATSTLATQDRDAVLTAHNDARKNDVPGNNGGPLPNLEWDDALATASQTYADTLGKTKCGSIDHDDKRGDVGENLAQGSTTDASAPPQSGADAVKSWVAEKVDYTYTSNTCAPDKMCGHYTQIVWRDTNKVGCGRATCTADDFINTVWVCRYSPSGNVNTDTTKPY